jgi:hypothetical protein
VALADVNSDRWPDLLVANNDAAMQVFESVPPPGARSLTVELKALPVLTIGALVKVTLESGKTFIREISAGGSYLSQSSSSPQFTIPIGESAKSISVRWSDGETTSAQVTSDTMSISRGH